MQSCLMNDVSDFDFPAWRRQIFPGLKVGGHLLQQWTIALQFEIGLDQIRRAEQIFDALTGNFSQVVR